MKKLFVKVQKWWLLSFRNKRLCCVKVGGFIFTFRRYWLDIRGISDNWRMRLRSDMHPYGYLYAAFMQDKVEQLHGYAASVYIASTVMTQDKEFADGLLKELNKYIKRQEIAAEAAAEKVTDTQEQSDENLMRGAAEYARMTPKQRKKAREDMRNIIKEEKEEDGRE